MWRDGKVQRVEDLLPNFIAALEVEADYLRTKIEDEKIECREIQLKREKRARFVSDYCRESARVSTLQEQAGDWEEAEKIRRYIAAVRIYSGKTLISRIHF